MTSRLMTALGALADRFRTGQAPESHHLVEPLPLPQVPHQGSFGETEPRSVPVNIWSKTVLIVGSLFFIRRA